MKIYIENSLNGICGKNYDKYLYMSEYDILEVADFIEEDLDGNEFIDTTKIDRKYFYDKKDLKQVCKDFNVEVNLLLEMLSWESPETLAIYLEEYKEEFEY